MDPHVIARARARRRNAVVAARMAAVVVGVFGVAGIAAWAALIRMPGSSYAGAGPPLTDEERAIEAGLRRDVTALAGDLGDRSMPRAGSLAAAADVIEAELRRAGYAVQRQAYEVGGQVAENLEATLAGTTRADEIVVIGAHYDSVAGTMGADDDASGVAALLAVARAFTSPSPRSADPSSSRPARTLRFVAFANEEPPYFQTPAMGSLVYARACRARGDHVVAMLSLESVGFYSDRPGSQRYPFPFGLFYPATGDFVGFVGDTSSRDLVRSTLASFRGKTRFPSEGVAAPAALPGIGWSDHWSFWQAGYPAVMVTDTAPFRNPDYHTTHDLPDRLSYAPFARVVAGLVRVVQDLAEKR